MAMRVNKIALPIIILFMCIAMFSGCNRVIDKPDTNLEFWIAEDVTDFDFSGYRQTYMLMGGNEYFGTEYSSDSEKYRDGQYVKYTVTNYPDFSSKSKHITAIEITDPAIEIYGLSLKSSANDIKEVMKSNGYGTADGRTFKNGKVTINFSDIVIKISVEVTNILGILY